MVRISYIVLIYIYGLNIFITQKFFWFLLLSGGVSKSAPGAARQTSSGRMVAHGDPGLRENAS